MEEITLRPIDQNNFVPCFHLKLGDGQERFVSDPVRSLAQAYVYRNQCTPFGIYCGETMVGYVLVLYDDEENTYNLWHMMIDAAHQGHGYGRRGLRLALDYIATQPFGASRTVLLTCNPDNTVAYGLYERMGFRRTGRDDEDEVEMSLTV